MTVGLRIICMVVDQGQQAGLPFQRISVAIEVSDYRGETMNSLFQAEEASSSTVKKVAITVAILAVFGLVLWKGLEMALRLISGR